MSLFDTPTKHTRRSDQALRAKQNVVASTTVNGQRAVEIVISAADGTELCAFVAFASNTVAPVRIELRPDVLAHVARRSNELLDHTIGALEAQGRDRLRLPWRVLASWQARLRRTLR